MKHTFFVLLLIACTLPVLAQEETLIPGEIESGGFGGPVLKVGSINGETGLLVGGRGGWIINHSFIIGGGGYGLATNVRAVTPGPNGERYFGMGYGGLELEYVPSSDRLVHLSFLLLVGGGGVDYRRDALSSTSGHMNDAFLVIEPQVSATLNVTRWFRVSAGMSYRIVDGVDIAATSDSKLSGPSGSLTARFGTF